MTKLTDCIGCADGLHIVHIGGDGYGHLIVERHGRLTISGAANDMATLWSLLSEAATNVGYALRRDEP